MTEAEVVWRSLVIQRTNEDTMLMREVKMSQKENKENNDYRYLL